MICLDANGDAAGLLTVDRDGDLVGFLTEDDVTGAPTWTGDGRVVFMRDVDGDGTTSLWAIAPEYGGKPEFVTNGQDGSDSHPDWSDEGLLFLRTRDGASDVVYMESLDARGVNPITSSGTAQSPTWAPGGNPAVVWLEPATEGDGRTLWTKALNETSPLELNTGAYRPPRGAAADSLGGLCGLACVSARQCGDEGGDQRLLLLLVGHDGDALVAYRHLQRWRRGRPAGQPVPDDLDHLRDRLHSRRDADNERSDGSDIQTLGAFGRRTAGRLFDTVHLLDLQEDPV